MNIIRKFKNLLLEYQKAKPRPVIVENITLSQNQLLKGRRAFITGGTSGIGFEIAKSFLNAGAEVIITGRNEDKLNAAIQKLSPLGKIDKVILDVRNTKETENTISDLFEKGKWFDILVNNAGVAGNGIPYITEEDFDNVIATNLRGALFCSQIFAKKFVESGLSQGNILNIASSSSLRPANSTYILSKWGIRGLTPGLAKTLAPYGITVNGIAPGPTATPMLVKPGDSLELKTSAIGRYIMPEEIANMAVVLVSPIGRSVVGDIIYMTGGAGVITFDDVSYKINL